MIQVLHRAFNILEHIAYDKSKPHTITEIATALDINQGTCANIIKTMVDRGYLVQVSKRAGYRLGDMSYLLTDNFEFKEKLIKVATKPLRNLAQKLNEGTILAILKANQRIVLFEEKSTHEIQVINKHSKDVYSTSTGRVMLAFMDEENLNQYVKQFGLPNENTWPGAGTIAGFNKELNKISTRSLAVQTTSQGIVGLAVPILANNMLVGSIGVYLPEHRYSPAMHEDVVDGLKLAAQQIMADLKRINGN